MTNRLSKQSSFAKMTVIVKIASIIDRLYQEILEKMEKKCITSLKHTLGEIDDAKINYYKQHGKIDFLDLVLSEKSISKFKKQLKKQTKHDKILRKFWRKKNDEVNLLFGRTKQCSFANEKEFGKTLKLLCLNYEARTQHNDDDIRSKLLAAMPNRIGNEMDNICNILENG